MGVEAFIWSYRDGEVAPIAFDDIRNVFADHVVEWNGSNGILRVCFGDERATCDIYCGSEAESANSVNGLVISRPVQHADLWRCVVEVMRLGNLLLFFSDATTPLFLKGNAVPHFPKDVLESLGEPRIVNHLDDITAMRLG